MIIIPAIDLRSGKVVRLKQGRFEDETVYSDDPLGTAGKWIKEGAQIIHVVDLDAALTGKPKNISIIEEIVGNVKAKIELGGGLREIPLIERLINLGVERVVIGTKAVVDEAFLDEALRRFSDKILVSIDVRNKFVATSGWKGVSGLQPVEFASLLAKKGVKRVIYTDISRDGMLAGPNLEGLLDILNKVDISVIVSGGVSSLDDIEKIRRMNKKNIEGVIIGKALYENKFSLKDAMETAKKGEV